MPRRGAPRRGRREQANAGVFDAAIEEPGLLEADGRARRARASVPRRAQAAGQGPGPGPVARKRRAAAVTPPSLMIEPRIAARRAEVELDEAAAAVRRRRRRAAAILVVVMVMAGGAVAGLSPLAGVRTIQVVGAARTSPAAVRTASDLKQGSPLLRVDADRVTARLAALPWVQRATLERRWPHTVVLRVEERQPAAVAPCLVGTCLVDRTGRVLAAAAAAGGTTALPHLEGVPAADGPGSEMPASARGALDVATALPSALRPLVLAVRGEGGEVTLELQAPGRSSTPPVIRLGTPDRIGDKLTAAATVLARTSVNGIATLDVRVPESPALTRAGLRPAAPR
ncbi:MAG: FtsQ-type POTRA domain-containing protein [Acidimicrobiales bacterium]